MAAVKEILSACTRTHYAKSGCKYQHIRQSLEYAKILVCKRNNSSYTTTPFPEFTENTAIKTHEDLHRFSLENPDEFWGKLARSRLKWYKDFHRVKDGDMSGGNIRWFDGGRLNASVNCIDRHLETRGDQVALIWEKDEPGTQEKVTYRELSAMVNKMANVLRKSGVGKGDRVAIYLPQSPVAVATMLACARIGALHSVVFAGFSSEALAGRITDAQAETVITADQGIRGGKIIELKKTVDAAVEKCPCVKRVFVYKRTGGNVSMNKLDIALDKALEGEPESCEASEMESEDSLFMLYTSGSTGKPKGLAHSTAGYLLYANVTFKHAFDYQDGEVFGCMADIGWITGHSYVVYGPLSNGATTLLFESTPVYPNPVGEPLNVEAWEWFYNVVGEKRCDIIDTWWQTETGGIAIAPRPSAPGAEIKPGMPMRPFLGIEPVLVDEKGKELVGNDVYGALCIKRPWPGITRTIYGNHERYMDTYFRPFPGYYCTGDGAHRTSEGYYQITGRMDDVLNVTGHRLGTAEIEDAITEHPGISEAAVVGFPHDIKGEGVYAYVTLKDNVNLSKGEILKELEKLVKQKIASYAVPDVILITPSLPRTRSGKIMRRILRKIATEKFDELGDVSTLAEPDVVEMIIKIHNKITNGNK